MGPSSCLKSEDIHPEGGALRKRTSRVGGCRGTVSVLSGMQGQEGQTADSKRQQVCDVCSATFLKPAHLQQHLVIHTGQVMTARLRVEIEVSFKIKLLGSLCRK